jgi:sodium/potassium-transporting ATPase subunit alpha
LGVNETTTTQKKKKKKKKRMMTESDEESMRSCSTEGSLDLEHRHLKQSLYHTAESAPWSDPSDAAVVAVVVEDVEKVGDARRLQTSNPAKAKAKINSIQALKQEVVMDEHIISVDALCQRLATALDNGLSLAEHRTRLARDGPNRLSPPKQVPGWVKLLKHLFLGFSGLLWIAAILCFIAYGFDPTTSDNLALAIVLIVVVVITALFAAYQEGRASAAMKGFAKMVPDAAVVLRGGEKVRVEAAELVVGDVIEVKGGDKIPADFRIVSADGFKVDNSSLTGESEAQQRMARNEHDNPLEATNLAFFTTFATEGVATGVVVSTGDRTVIGRIAQLVMQTKNVETPLVKEINRFIKLISAMALAIGVVFLIVALVIGYPALVAIVFVIGIVVANVPEGLLATVTVSLTLTAKRMAKKNVLIKSLSSVETLGSTSTICSDKTGTLTQNRMTASHLYYDGLVQTNDPGASGAFDANDATCMALLRIAAICNRATFADAEQVRGNRLPTKVSVQSWATIGDASESALLKLVHVVRSVDSWRDANPKLVEIPFNSTNKYQLSIHEPADGNGRLLLVIKGAPERIVARCATHLSSSGTEQKFGKRARADFEAAYVGLAKRGERVLGFAHLWLDAAQYDRDFAFETDPPNFPVDGLCFVGLISLIDPPRDSVPEAVRLCTSAGIKVIMVTGDHPLTAETIARQVGIIRSESANELAEERGVGLLDVPLRDARAIVVHGELLRDMSDAQLDAVLAHEQIVFARTSPQQKLRIVEGCQRRGEIVAVTGDGVNDSPALKKADIGIAMGIAGSDVSKEAAKMILMDDNFASIVRGIEEGRLISDNLKKSIAYTVSSNIPELIPFLAFIAFRLPLGLTTFLILCIDIGTDMLPAISLAYEEAESDIMQRKPRNPKTDHLVNARLIGFAYFTIGVAQTMAGFFTFLMVLSIELGLHPSELLGSERGASATSYGFSGSVPMDMWLGSHFVSRETRALALRRGQSSFLLSIVLTQWIDLLICKTRKRSLFQQGMRNIVLWAGLVVETALVCLLIYVPFFHTIFSTADVSGMYWLLPLPFMVWMFVYDELRKWLIRRDRDGSTWVTKHTYY